MYFCKNCGEPFLNENNNFCEQCGSARNSGNSYCHNCGNPVGQTEEVCQVCGVATGYHNPFGDSGFGDKSQDMYPYGANQYDPNIYGSNAYGVGYTSNKSRIAAGLLAIFLGSWGIHNFYLGYTNKAVTQLVLTIVGNFLICAGIGIFIIMGTYIWGIAEGIMLLSGKIDMDGQGQRLIG